MADDLVNVRYLVDDVDAALSFYTTHLGFTELTNFSPAFADVVRGKLRLLLSGPTSSAGRSMPDGRKPKAGGWNRIHLIVDDIDAETARAARRRGRVPQRHRERPGWQANRARRSLGQPGRALPTR